MKRIALISEHASPLAAAGTIDSGGQNIYVGQLARNLALRQLQVDIFTRRDRPGLEPVVSYAPGVRIVHVPAGPECFVAKESMLPLMRPFGVFLRKHFQGMRSRYDVVHANFFMSGLAAQSVAREFGIPLVMTFHALGLVRRRYQRQADRFPEERIRIERSLVHRAQRIIAECRQDREDLLSLYEAPASRIEVVPCGVDARNVMLWDRGQARRHLGWEPDEFVVLQLGRLVPRKGIDNVVRGIAALAHAGVRARLRVVGGDGIDSDTGSAAEVARLIDIARVNGVAEQVEFLGSVPHGDVGLYYSAADVFVTTPWYEPFGITPLEAMVCAIPVIGSAVGGIRSTVVHGETGFLVAPHDPGALATRLFQLYADPNLRQKLGAAGRTRAIRYFSWRGVAQQVAAVYQHAIDTQCNRVASACESGIQEGKPSWNPNLLRIGG